MRYLNVIILSVLLAVPLWADTVQTNIEKAAKLAGVNPQLLLAVCFVESSFRENLKPHMDGATESHGVCQVKLETAQHMDKVYKHTIKATVERLQNPFVNAFYAAKVLRYQLKRYNNDWKRAIDAYNKGHFVSQDSAYVHKVIKAIVAQND